MIQDIAPHKFDIAYRNKMPESEDIVLVYCGEKLLCRMEEGEIFYPTVRVISTAVPEINKRARFLFRIDETDYFELPGDKVEPFLDMVYVSKEDMRTVRPIWRAYAGITGYQIHKWYSENQFCGRCGSRMEPHGKERALQCNKCHKVIYPTISPSVIVGVTDGGRILLTKYQKTHSKFQKYALVAGYTEVGESLEDTVRREVFEEVGLKVKNVRYYKSQPWSFTDTLLVGYFCETDGGNEITLEVDELSEAGWFSRGELPEERSKGGVSLTGEMINAFKDGLV